MPLGAVPLSQIDPGVNGGNLKLLRKLLFDLSMVFLIICGVSLILGWISFLGWLAIRLWHIAL
jgi:hypothetical protein